MKKPPRDVVFEAAIDDLSHDGRGVAHVDGKTVFVSDALPGERVRAKLLRRHRNFDEAHAGEILAASPDRVTPRCPHFGTCGGCVLQHLAPVAQIAAKQNILAQNFARIGQVAPARWLAPLTAGVWGYRRRARLSVRLVPKKGKTLVGFRERDPRFVADLVHCDVLDPALGDKLDALGALLDDMQGAASIPQIEFSAGDAARVLVFRHLAPLPDADQRRLAAFGRAHGFAILLQPGGTDSVHPLDGQPVDLHYALPDFGLKLAFAPLDFVQVNARINEKMIEHALAGEVRGSAWARAGWDAVLLDPPRSGADESLKQLPGKSVRRVVYVSCHPASLARDAGTLVREHGFRLEAADRKSTRLNSSHHSISYA